MTPDGHNLTNSSHPLDLKQTADEIRTLGKRVVADIIRIGELLTLAQKRVGHGNFSDWIDREFSWGLRTAENYMRAYALSKSETVSDMEGALDDLPIGVLHVLARPSTPSEVVSETLKAAKEGNKPTQASVKQSVASKRGDTGGTRPPKGKPVPVAGAVIAPAGVSGNGAAIPGNGTGTPGEAGGVEAALVAQPVEHRAEDAGVDGSIPSEGTKSNGQDVEADDAAHNAALDRIANDAQIADANSTGDKQSKTYNELTAWCKARTLGLERLPDKISPDRQRLKIRYEVSFWINRNEPGAS